MEITSFEHNGISIVKKALPAPMGPLGKHIVCWVGTAPDKHADVPFNVPFRVANTTDAAKLDTTGEEEGWLWYAVTETLKKVQVPQYVIVVPEGADATETLNNVIGGIDAATGQRTGIAAISLCTESPTIIAAPGYTHQKPASDALVAEALKLMAFPHLDGLSTSTKAVIDYSLTLATQDTGYDIATLIDPQPSIYSKAAGANVYVPPSVLSVGCHAGVALHESPGNKGTYAQGVQRDITYDIMDTTTEGDLLNRHGICYFGRTDLGGISLLGNRTLSGRFINQVCLEQAICRKLKKSAQKVMAENLDKSFMEQEIAKLNAWGAQLKANEEVIGMEVSLHPELNTAETFRNGTWYIAIRYAGFPPNEHMVYHLIEDIGIIDNFISEIL
ncbi:phage tail protein [Vibrio rotiferianus]|uniref:phage tail protein n=1 Tax=Vibrio rotiferianus TaxID=190895 RepID=UPI0015F4D7A2|nr:phage tail protein [Vibrio rotiferianus]